MTYREFFSHVVDVVEGVGAAILVLGGLGAFLIYGYELTTRSGRAATPHAAVGQLSHK